MLLIICGVKERAKESVSQHQNHASLPATESTGAGSLSLFSKDDIKGVWTSGETENASFSIEEDSVLFVDALEYVEYAFTNDTLLYMENNIPFFKTRVLKADEDSLITCNEDGVRRFWRFRD